MSDEEDQALRDIVKSAGVVYVGLLLELLIAFLAQVLAARYLSVGGFGGLTVGTALLDVGSIVAGLGLGRGMVRYFPRIRGPQRRMLGSVVVVITLTTSISLGLLIALNAEFIATVVFGSPGVAASIRIFGAAIPFATLLNVSIGGIRGQELSLYRVYVKNLIHPIVRFGLVIAAVMYGLGQAGMATAYATPYVVSSIIALLLLHRALPGSRASFDGSLLTDVTRYSLPFTVTGVSNFVYRSIDIFLVLYLLGDTATGVYGVAYAAVSFMGMFSTAFNYLGSPIASKLESRGNVDEVMAMFGTIARWLVVASVCMLVPLGVFATEFITVIYQSKYASGGSALAILAFGFAMKNVLSIHEPILEAIGWSKTLSFNSAAAAGLNVALNLVLIPRIGIVGAAVATVLSYLLRDGLATAQVWYGLRRTPITGDVIKPVLVAVPFFVVLVTSVKPLLPTTLLWLLGGTGVFALLYLGTVLAMFGLSEREVMIIRSAEEKYGLELGPVDPLIRLLSER